MYYGALRPCEVNRLREQDCKLPDTGWGESSWRSRRRRTNGRYTDSGELWEKRASSARRRAMFDRCRSLRWSWPSCGGIRTPSERAAGRLFRGNSADGPMNATVYTDAWEKARRESGCRPEQFASPLAESVRPPTRGGVHMARGRRASCRGGGTSWPHGGRSVEGLREGLDGQREKSNQKITELLGEIDAEQEDQDDGDDAE